MKKVLLSVVIFLILVSVLLPSTFFAYAAQMQTKPKDVASAYLVDYATGSILYEHNAHEKRQIASMVKIMTLLLAFEAMEQGRLSLEQEITISERASSMGGSQMFLETGDVYVTSDLIKGIIVNSANDASVAIAEVVSGSVEDFVADMNEHAKQLGMNNTVFVNVTGLPASGQYSTAHDVSIMTRELLAHKPYFEYSKIWIENFKHPDGRITELVNTNRLIRFYKDCDSGKTGFTNDAMFCLSASAIRGNMRVIATVLGGATSQARFGEVVRLFNYAFSNYEQKCIAKQGENIENNLIIARAKKQMHKIAAAEDVYLLAKKGTKFDYTVETKLKQDLKAPLKKGDTVGKLIVKDKKSGESIKECNLVLNEDIPKKSLGDALGELAGAWRF